jgi:hypothetical protein
MVELGLHLELTPSNLGPPSHTMGYDVTIVDTFPTVSLTSIGTLQGNPGRAPKVGSVKVLVRTA